MNYFLIKGDSPTPTILAHSITRYFRYILGIEIHFWINHSYIEPENNDLFFILFEPSEIESFFSWFHKNNFNPDRLRFIANDEKADINLLDVETLKTQIEHCFEVTRGIDLLGIPFIFNRIKTFFNGHGEQSLLSCISGVKYYLGNYSEMADSGEYSPIELNKTFFIPGMQYWDEFTLRFSKYASFLYVSGWDKQVHEIERSINVVTMDLKKAEVSDCFHTFSSETIQSLKKIIKSIENMASQIDRKQDETNTADR